MGDPAGIGAETIVKALKRAEVYEKCVPVVIGDLAVIKDAISICRASLEINIIQNISMAKGIVGTIDLINMDYIKENGWEYKRAAALCGKACFSYVTYAIQMALKGEINAVVTAPINKEALHMAGYQYSGHTEIFADFTHTSDYAMLLVSEGVKVIHVSTHCSLREACDKVKKERVYKVIRLAERGLNMLGYSAPKIAVAGLNPHCSENGLFGYEEEKEIRPAIEKAKKEGIDVYGPEAPDTVFVKCRAGVFDVVVAMYHDQGHIPLKLCGFQMDLKADKFTSVSGINCTIGLPIIRTSVDHGTAYGKAGEGRANEDSMLDAINAAITMADYRQV